MKDFKLNDQFSLTAKDNTDGDSGSVTLVVRGPIRKKLQEANCEVIKDAVGNLVIILSNYPKEEVERYKVQALLYNLEKAASSIEERVENFSNSFPAFVDTDDLTHIDQELITYEQEVDSLIGEIDDTLEDIRQFCSDIGVTREDVNDAMV